MGLTIVPVTFRQACVFIAEHHRHHRPPAGMKFALGVADDSGELVGVATVGRPVARHMDDGRTLEVTRTCTRGSRNANSMLYGTAWRVARAMGYRRMITYTQQGETGASLRAAGLHPVAMLPARPGWHTPSRPRTISRTDRIPRTRWEIRRETHVGASSPVLKDATTLVSETLAGNTCAPAVSNGTAGRTRHHQSRPATITPVVRSCQTGGRPLWMPRAGDG
jgi:hypothetical protein